MANVLKTEKQIAVVQHLVEGCSIRTTERITGVHRDTICRLLVRVGNGCRELLDAEMRNLTLRHIECDEIWTFVGRKQGRLGADEKRFTNREGDIYLWVAQDQDSKLVPTFAIGKRTADNARRFMVDLANRLALPRPTDTGERAGVRPQISTDGFAAYPEAIDLAFGRYCTYGQLIKDYRNSEMPGRYAAPELIGAERRQIFGSVDPNTICTSHVERNNLTIRTMMKRFARLSLGFSKKLENLAAATALHVAYFNFCWRPRENGKSGRLRMTPAMQAGVTTCLWSVEDLYHAAML